MTTALFDALKETHPEIDAQYDMGGAYFDVSPSDEHMLYVTGHETPQDESDVMFTHPEFGYHKVLVQYVDHSREDGPVSVTEIEPANFATRESLVSEITTAVRQYCEMAKLSAA